MILRFWVGRLAGHEYRPADVPSKPCRKAESDQVATARCGPYAYGGTHRFGSVYLEVESRAMPHVCPAVHDDSAADK